MSVSLATEKKAQGLKSILELRPILLTTDEVVVLDIETTGFSLEKHSEIIEIGAVKVNVNNHSITGKFSQLIRPSNAFSIPAKITELTSIDWAQVADAPFIEDVLPQFYKFLNDAPIVAHNASFDWPRFLVPAFRTVGLHATNEAICTMMLAKELYPGRGRAGYNLEALCNMFGSTIEGHHRAWVDCKWTASLFLRMLDEYRRTFGAEGVMLFEQNGSTQPMPNQIGYANLADLRINRVSFYEGQSKRHGPSIYVSTNFGKISYSVRRHVWTVHELWCEQNVPANRWGAQILKQLGMDPASFVSQYLSAG